jgi:ParB family transcriptional regulator, chromosome partitioning protein
MNTAPTLEMLDPGTLTIDTNVRKDADLKADFIASIKELGVLEPVIAHRKDDGTVHVLMGQRRTLGAVEAGRESIPVMIVSSPEEADRIVTQVVENIQRTELTEGDEADAYHQLSLIGVPASVIAKQTGRTRTAVESALKAKASNAGAKALHNGYTVQQALILAEFESDQAATAEIESVIRDEPEYLEHVTQRLRDDRDAALALAGLKASLEAEGRTVVEEAGRYGDSESMRVDTLKRADGEPATDQDANAVLISTDYRRQHTAVPVVTGWKDLGFIPKYERYDGGTSAQKGPMTEEQKAERKTLIANNKSLESVHEGTPGICEDPAVPQDRTEGLAVLHRPRHHPPPRNRQRLRRQGCRRDGRSQGRAGERSLGMEPVAGPRRPHHDAARVLPAGPDLRRV